MRLFKALQYPLGDNPATARLWYGSSVLEVLPKIDDNSVDVICTSPPYWGLRDYRVKPSVWGGDAECTHEWKSQRPPVRTNPGGAGINRDRGSDTTKDTSIASCGACGAWRGQLGLEPRPQMYIDHIVSIFAAIRRVLKPEGDLWLNLGDTYFGSATSSSAHKNFGRDMVAEGRWPVDRSAGGYSPNHKNEAWPGARKDPAGFWRLKPKDLVGIPWRVALALRASGWHLVNDVVWAKGTCMPESVTDRVTRSHEYIFRFANSECPKLPSEVWEVNPRSYPGAHFAVWPEALVQPMIEKSTERGGTVLDPFSGSGTTGKVALKMGRNYIGIDMGEQYLDLAEACILGHAPPVEIKNEDPGVLGLFGC